MCQYVTLDRTFYSIFLVTVSIRDTGQNVLQSFLVNGRIRDIGQNVLRSPIGNCVST